YREVMRELDRRVGPDGLRSALRLGSGELDLRLNHHYGVLPTVEMEPDVPYRYLQSELLTAEVKDRLFTRSVPLFAIGMAFLPLSLRGNLGGVVALGFVVLMLGGVWMAVPDLVLLRGIRDRFVRRGDVVYVL